MDRIFSCGWAATGNLIASARPTISSGSEYSSGPFTLAASASNVRRQVGFDVANLKGILITVSGNTGGTVVLKTNDTGSPGTTLTFPAGGGELFWTHRSPLSNPFGSTDVTDLYFTNNGTADATVEIHVSFDAAS